MKRFGLAAWLVIIWIFLWGEVSVANLLSGIAVSVALLLSFSGDRSETDYRYVLRPLPFLRLVGYLLSQLVRSNLLLAREVVSRNSRLRTAVIAAPLRTQSKALITATCNMMALNPGTLVIEIDEPGGIVYVHVFFLNDIEEVNRSVDDLQRLVINAFHPSHQSETVEPIASGT